MALRSRKAHSLYYLLLDIIANIITFILLLLFIHYFIYHYCINDNTLCNVSFFVYCMLCIIYLLLVLYFIIIIFWLFAQACVLIVCPTFLGGCSRPSRVRHRKISDYPMNIFSYKKLKVKPGGEWYREKNLFILTGWFRLAIFLPKSNLEFRRRVNTILPKSNL